ncbi:protein split ends isoform X2 [Sabethes cyaneus]|uniref:protein split ends isoform X2 n=1 Tax=Sabethes cyaneus TaxID=53552 RepID=UPI00237ECE39|nr:protein split ends isoform X2 [Sabethes cyaneus]
MFSTFIGLIDIQSWWEVPCIAHFCSLFSGSFQLPDFDIEDLEEALLTDADVESEVDLKVYNARLLSDLIVALLKGCDALSQIVAHISPSNYQMFLRRLFRQKCQEYNIDNPFNTDTDFEKLPLRTKILILKYLCDFRLDSADVYNSFANLEADSLRVEPLGYDSKGSAYWYFFGTRLYREDYETPSGKGNKSSKRSIWQVICFTEEDWRNLAGKFQRSKNENERSLLQQLEENFLPNIPKIFRDKERERRNKLLERRTSSRIKHFEERRLADIYRQQEIEQAQKALQRVNRPPPRSETPPPPPKANPSEERAKRAERRSRSNSVTSIVSIYASSPEPLTSDLIFQPKETESLILNTTSNKHSSTKLSIETANLHSPASPSSELGSEQTASADILVCSEHSKRDSQEEVYEEETNASVIEQLINNNCTEVIGSGASVASSESSSSGVSSRNREKTPTSPLKDEPLSAPSTPPPPVTKKAKPKRPLKSLSAEIERLLQYNPNMAPTTTKLPGRQTNNSLSSITGPVILPFADTPPKTSSSSSGSKNGDPNAAASGGAGGGGGASSGGRKKKSKAAQVFTETEEVLQIGMHKVLEYIKNHDDAWPFMDPVDEDIAPRYYSIIRRPMDLQKMEEKLDNGEYLSFGDFRNDFKLIVNNCRLYNGQANEYTEMVNNLQLAFEKATKKYFDSNSSDEEQTLEYPVFKEKQPFAASGNSGSAGGKSNESTSSSTSGNNNNNNNSKSSKETKSTKSGGKKNSNSGKSSSSAKNSKSANAEETRHSASEGGNKKEESIKDIKKVKSESSENSVARKLAGSSGNSAKKTKPTEQTEKLKNSASEGKGSNAKGLKRKRKEKDKSSKGKTKKFKPSESDEEEECDENGDEQEEEKVSASVNSSRGAERTKHRSPTPDRQEEKKKSSSKSKRKEQKGKEHKGRTRKSEKEEKPATDKRDSNKKERQRSRSRSRSGTKSRSVSPAPKQTTVPSGSFLSPKKVDKRREPSTPKHRHGKKSRTEEHLSDQDDRTLKADKTVDSSLSSISPSPVKNKRRSKGQTPKHQVHSVSEECSNSRTRQEHDDLSNASADAERSSNVKTDDVLEESVKDTPAAEKESKRDKKSKKSNQKSGKNKGKSRAEEKSKKVKQKGKNGRNKKSKGRSLDDSSLVSHSNDDEINDSIEEDKNKNPAVEKEIISASKKQPKDFSKYTTLPRDRSTSRSFSRSPSPLPSIRDDYSSFSDHSMEFDEDVPMGSPSKKLPTRPITPDIIDKYDLIKQRRRNQTVSVPPTVVPPPANDKTVKAKSHKTQEGSRKKQKSDQPQTNSPSASSTLPPMKGTKNKVEEEQPLKVKEAATKGKKKRDRSPDASSHDPVEPVSKWNAEAELRPPSLEKPRPSYKDEKVEKQREPDKKAAPCDEYDFVDDSPLETIAPKQATPIASPIEKIPKPVKNKTDSSSRKQNQKPNKTPHGSSSRPFPIGGANKQPKQSGANMEALELETEQTLKDINKWLENTPRFSEYSSASNSPSRYIMDDLDAVTAKIDAADFRKPIPLSQLPEESDKPSLIPSPQLSIGPPPLVALSTPSVPSVMSPKRVTPPIHGATSTKEAPKSKLPKEQSSQDVNPLKESSANVPISSAKPQQQQQQQAPPPTQTVPAHNLPAPPPIERPLLGPPPIIPPHSQKKEPKEPKRKSLKEKLSQLGSRKRETVQHHRTTIDRLQPELFPLGGGSGVIPGASVGLAGTKLKEVKNSLIVKTDESKPKLSLGTVLNTAEGFGLGQQHEFADEKKENVETVETATSDMDKPLDSLSSSKIDSISSQTDKLLIHDDLKAAKAELARTDPAKVMESPEKVIKAVTKSDKPSATPNLSAWFKAFGGAPKKQKKTEESDESASKSSPNDGTKGSENTSPSDVPQVPSLESPSYPSLPAPRQRKASTGSTVSERSSYSQDPDSPRIGIDERIGVYPAPYPSPMGASPVMTSPKLDDTQKSPYPMNGAIKVGFYQDTTTKSSPEKSCSPRDLPSPYPQYSQHLYTANSGMAANSVYGNYSYGANSAVAVTASTNSSETFKSYDQYKQPASQESDYNSSMSPSTNPNSPYHNQQSSPYQQQPNSPYQQQQQGQSYNQQQPIPSPASSGPLSPYSNNSLAPQSVQQSPAQSVSGHSPFNPSPTSPYQTPQHQSQNQQPPQPQKPNQSQQQPTQHSSKPNTPIHQSPNSPFSQSNHSSPYSQQDPNSPYSQGQLSPFQPMSPKPSPISTIPQGTTNNSLKLAPPIITPQQAAAAAGVTLPESPVNNLSQQQTSPQHQQQQPQHPAETPGSQQTHQQSQLPSQLNTQQNPWNQQQQTSYNQYSDSSSLTMGTTLPAPAHMHHHHQHQPQQSQSQPQQQQKPQPAHHNVQQMPPSAAHLLSSQQPQPQQQQHQQTPSCGQQQNLNNLTPAHTQPSNGQQQHSHLSTLLSSNNPYTSNYGRQAYESAAAAAQSQPQQHDASNSAKNQPTKVPDLINLGYNSSGSNEISSKAQPQHQEVPMNMGAKAADNTKEKEMAKQQQMFELMGAMGYGNPMDISISKSKAFDMFNRAATMTFPRGFPSANGQTQHQPQQQPQQQDATKITYGGSNSAAGYDQMQTNTNKAHDMSGSQAYGMPHQQSQQSKSNQNDILSAGNLRGNTANYDQRPAAPVTTVPPHQQHHPQQQQQQQSNMDLSTGYKAFSGQSASSLMDPAIRNLASLSSLYQADERLLASSSSTAGYYDKSIPPAAHMYGKNLSSDTSSTIGSTTASSALQQMFNTSMATTMAYNAAARDQQAAYGANYHHHQRSDLLGQGQKVPLNIPSVANTVTAAPEPTKPKRGRKKKENPEQLQQQQQQHQQMQHPQQTHQHPSQQQQPNAAHQGFQTYSGLKTTQPSSSSNQTATTSSVAGNVASNTNSEPSVISLKTANIVPGSAFNFGPGPTGLGLPTSLYGENSPYLDEFRANPNPYPYLASSHPRGPTGSSSSSGGPAADGSDKVANASAASTSAAVAVAAVAAAAVHQPPPPAASPYHQFLSHPSSRPSPYQFMNQLDPLHHPYMRQEEFRAQMMLNQSLGLGAPGAHGPPPGAYGQPAAYHPALGIHKPYDAMNSMNRPPWL